MLGVDSATGRRGFGEKRWPTTSPWRKKRGNPLLLKNLIRVGTYQWYRALFLLQSGEVRLV